MTDIKLICSDIDGTLVRDDKSLSAENIHWIRKVCEEKGVKFVITTGRMLSALTRYYDAIGIKGLGSCINGCLLYTENDEVLADHRLPSSIARRVYEISRGRNLDMLAIAANEWYTEDHDSYLYQKKRPIYAKDSHIVIFEDVMDDMTFNKLLYMSPDKNALLDFEKAIREGLDSEDDVTYYPGPDFLEIMPSGITKGTAIDDLAHCYGLDYSEIMAIGDDINDIEMLRRAGASVAMGNALPEVKKVARYTTTSNEDDGVANIIREVFYKEDKDND